MIENANNDNRNKHKCAERRNNERLTSFRKRYSDSVCFKCDSSYIERWYLY